METQTPTIPKIRDGWFTTDEAARVLGVTRPRVIQLIKEGKLTAERIGRDYFLRKDLVKGHTLTRPPGRPRKDS